MNAPPVPPPGTNFLAVLKAPLDDIYIGHTFAIILIPLLVALFYFSTSASRKHPIFILNVLAIMLSLAVGGLLDARAYRVILEPLNPPSLSWNLATGFLGVITSILVDIILLLRLIAVYPRPQIGPTRFYLMITPPIVLKALRLANLIAFSKALADATIGVDPKIAPALVGKIWETAPYLKIEWFSQLVDNSYASALFLMRLGMRNRLQTKVVSNGGGSSAFTRKIQQLMYIAVANFVFPALFSLIQIIIVFREINLVIVNEIILVNTSVAVIGVVFATVWAGSGHRDEQGHIPNGLTDKTPPRPELSTIVFTTNQSRSRQTGSTPANEAWTAASALEATGSNSSFHQVEK